MYDVQKTSSGSYRCGPDLFARKCEGGFELWRAARNNTASPWDIGSVVATKEAAIAWLKAWAKDVYNVQKNRNR